MKLRLDFGTRGNAMPYCGIGWSVPEANLTWTVGTKSTLRLPMPPGEADLLLEMHVEPFVTPEQPGHLVTVSVNQVELGHALLLGETVLSVPIPRDKLAGAASIRIILHQHDAGSPLGAELDDDDRELALAVHSVQLTSAHGAPQQPGRADEFVPHCGRTAIARAASFHLTFGDAGNAEGFQRHGWSEPEDGFTWSVGPQSRLRLPVPAATSDLVLELHIEPQTTQSVPGQRLIVSVNGIEIFRDTVRAVAILSLPIPRSAYANARTLVIAFAHPDAVAPPAAEVGYEDDRTLAFAFYKVSVEPAPQLLPWRTRTLPPLPASDLQALGEIALARTGLALEDLALRFESLGHNCEFAFVQNQFGVDPSGLLRWTSIKLPALVSALRRSFAGIADPDNLEVIELVDENDPVGEWMVRDKLYETETHTALSREQAAENIVLWQAQRMFAKRYKEMLATLKSGDKICVFQDPNIRSKSAIKPVATALAKLGPNALLWVSENSGYASGSVTTLQEGVLLGAIDRLAPETAVAETDVISWGSIMVNAYCVWREAARVPELADGAATNTSSPNF
jgi:hypothetical protein